ncbi:alpha/beta-hydrolase [Xylariaceae sp. FL0255]|nr:alpha/beta-hydrolase [Xylariaceae sp. FL0255]
MPMIVNIQGSFQLPDPYQKLVAALEAKQYHVIPPQLPSLTDQDEPDFGSKDLKTDAIVVRDVIRRLVIEEEKPVVVVMHSYGGLVGIEAVTEDLAWTTRASLGLKGGVIHLFFYAAFVLPKGQSVLGAYGEGPSNIIKPGGRFTIKDAAKILYSDLPAEEAEYWESKVVDQSWAVQTTEITQDAYRDVPSTYVVCEKDKGPPPQAQEMWALASNSRVLRLDSGHSPMLSRTEELVDLIDEAITKAVESLS